MGILLNIIPSRLEQRVAESWRQLVTRVAADRGIRITDVQALGALLWREWTNLMTEEDYAEEVYRRQRALRRLLHGDVAPGEFDDVMAMLTAAMPPERFHEHVIGPIMREVSLIEEDAPSSQPLQDAGTPQYLAHIIAQTNALAGRTGSI